MNATQTKRKTINDFFLPAGKHALTPTDKYTIHRKLKVTPEAQDKSQQLPIPGLTLYQDFISGTEEQEILAFLNDSSQCTWRTDLSRRTMHFGGTYCLLPAKSDLASTSKPQILQAPPMPHQLSWLIQRMVDANVFSSTQRPQYCIINEYTGNLGISAHTENFQFAEPVVGLSLLSAGSIRYHELTKPYDGSVRSGKAGKAAKTGRVVDVQMPDANDGPCNKPIVKGKTIRKSSAGKAKHGDDGKATGTSDTANDEPEDPLSLAEAAPHLFGAQLRAASLI